MELTDGKHEYDKSHAVHRSAAALIPGIRGARGGLWPVVSGRRPVIAKAKGATVTDVDGHSYVSYAGAPHGLVLGHADERIVVAVNKAVSKGLGPAPVSETAVRLAELITSRSSAIDLVRFLNAPAAAFHEVTRLARVFTGRERILRVEGCARRGQPATEGPYADNAGATEAGSFNNLAAVKRIFRTHGSKIAAILTEPVASAYGLILPVDGFLPGLRALCDEHGALLIYDESIIGFRVPAGAVPGWSDATPDICVFGATLDGGWGLGGYGGRKAIMQHLNAEAEAGIVEPDSGNQVAMGAAVATLQVLGEPGFFDELEARAAQLETGWRAASQAKGVPCEINRAGSVLAAYFSDVPVTTVGVAADTDPTRFERFYEAMLDRGILLPASPFMPLGVSAAHSKEQVEQTIEAVSEALPSAVAVD